MEDLQALYLLPNKTGDLGVACFRRDNVIGELIKRIGIGKFMTSFPNMGENIPDIKGGKCYFLSSRINGEMNQKQHIDCLITVKPDLLFFSPIDGHKVTKFCNMELEDEEEYHSCSEEPSQDNVMPVALTAKTPALQAESCRSIPEKKQSSGKYKTPRFASSVVAPGISVGEKVMPGQAVGVGKPVDSPRGNDEAPAESPPKNKECDLRVAPPFTPPKNPEEDEDVSKKLDFVWKSMKAQGFRTMYGFENQAHLGSKENTIYVIPGGKGYDHEGVENVEYFTNRTNFVRHLKRNFSLLEDFDSFWHRVEKYGWTKQWSSGRSECRYVFPVRSCGVSVDFDGSDNVDFSSKKELHDFPGRSSLHLHILRYPYPLQSDETLRETLDCEGWVSHGPNSFGYPVEHCHFVMADGSKKKRLTLLQVRQLLWTDPTLLYADVRHRISEEQLERLRAATYLPDALNKREVDDDALDRADSSLQFLLEYGSKCSEVSWSHPSGDKGLTFEIPEKDVSKLEKHLLNLKWEISDRVNTTQWWSRFRAYTPNWNYSIFDTDIQTFKKNNKGLIPGVDIFWCIGDVVKYIGLYQNAPPVDISKRMTLRLDMTREDGVEYLLKSCDADASEQDLFITVLPELVKSGWECVTIPSYMDVKCGRVERALLPYWVKDKMKSSISLDIMSSLVKDMEVFVSQGSVIAYLRVFGNKQASSKGGKASKSPPSAPVDNSTRSFPIPKYDKQGHIIEDDSVLEAEVYHLVTVEAKKRYISTEVINILERLGWRHDVQVDEKVFFANYVTLTPWALEAMEKGGDEVKLLRPDEDFFFKINDVIDYVEKNGVGRVIKEQTTSRPSRRHSVGNDTETASRCSESTTATAATKKKTKEVDVPAKKANAEATSKASAKGSGGGKGAKKGPPKSKHVTEQREVSEEEEEVETSSSSESSSDEQELTQESSSEEEEPFVDMYPHLADDGVEGSIKEAFVAADYVGAYKFATLKPYLQQLGWQFSVMSKSQIQTEYYTLPPWGYEDYLHNGNHVGEWMVRGKDYFVDNREVVEYVERIGVKKADESYLPPSEAEGRRARRVPSAMPPPVVIRPPVKKAQKSSFAVPKGNVSKKRKSPEKGSKKVTKKVDQKKQQQKKKQPSVTSQSSVDDSEDDDDITLSQIQSSMEQEEKTQPHNLPEVDRGCSKEIKDIIHRATTPPRLNVSKKNDVWTVLKEHHWTSKYVSFIIGADLIFLRPGLNIHKGNLDEFTRYQDYFCSEEEVSNFVRDQIIARGRNYLTLVDRARFTPYQPRMRDEESDDEADSDGGEVADENVIITHKLPSRGLYQSADDPYKALVDNYDAGSDVSDYENDVPSYLASLAESQEAYLEEEEECTQPQTVPSSASRSTRSGQKRRSPLARLSDDDVDSSSAKKARTSRGSVPRCSLLSTAEKENSAAVCSLGDVISRVKDKLSPSYDPNSIVGRETEFQELLGEVSSHLDDRRGGTIRIAGQPGQGKTLTTQWMLRTLEKESEEGDRTAFNVTWINGASMQGGFKELCQKLGVECSSEDQAKSTLNDCLLTQTAPRSSTKSRSRRSSDESSTVMRVIVIDEIDMLPKTVYAFILGLANHDHSNFVLVGLANNSAEAGYSREIVFEVYREEEMRAILKAMTEDLLDDKAATMLVKTTSSNGDIRPMANLAMHCVEKAERDLLSKCSSEEEKDALLNEPSKAIVTLPIVNACRQSSTLKLMSKMRSVPATARNLIVALALQFEPGQTFSLVQAQDALNTFGESYCMPRVDCATVSNSAQQLLEHALLNNTLPGNRSMARSTLSQLHPQKSVLSLSVSASELLEQCSSEIVEGAVRELQRTVKDREQAEQQRR